MTMETRYAKVIFPNYSKKKLAERYARTAAMENRGKNNCFSRIICSRCCTRRNFRFHVENFQHADQKELTRRLGFDLDIEATHDQPGSFRARPANVDDGLEDIRWIRGLGGEKLPAASYDLLPNLKRGLFFAIGEGSRIFVTCFLHSSAQMCSYQTAGRHPPLITGRFVNRCLSRTRKLAASNKHLA